MSVSLLSTGLACEGVVRCLTEAGYLWLRQPTPCSLDLQLATSVLGYCLSYITQHFSKFLRKGGNSQQRRGDLSQKEGGLHARGSQGMYM